MSFELRPYQQDALDAIRNSYESGISKQLIVIPTGGGKTVTFTSIPYIIPDSLPMLVLAHREELLDQAAKTISQVHPEFKVQIEQANRKVDLDCDIVVASVPTLGRSDSDRINKFSRDYFKTIVIDECHHASSKTYTNILDYFNFKFLLGVTATPQRSDNLRLTDVFEEIVYYKNMSDLIQEGWLSRIVGYRVKTSVDISSVKTVRGDFAEGQLQKAIDIPVRNDSIVAAYNDLTPDTKAIVFCAGVQHANNVALSFQKSDIPSAVVVGSTSSEERHRIFSDFRQGKIKVVVNVGVLTEGFDEPSVETIILARPTRSNLLYTQIVGRGVRLFEGKTHCNIIDIADATKGKKPLGLPSLMGLPPDFDLQGNDLLEVAEKYEDLLEKSPGRALKALTLDDIEIAYKQIDLFMPPPVNEIVQKYSRLVWVETSENNFYLTINENESLRIFIDTMGRWTVEHRDKSSKNPPTILGYPKDMRESFSRSDKWVMKRYDTRLIDSTAPWRGDPPTEKQIKILRKIGVPLTKEINKGVASQIISKYFEDNPRPQWLKNKLSRDKSIW
jgi:superfamily II DNA or RNA helicase